MKKRKADFLTTGIGRGHLFYLSGLYNAFRDIAPEYCGEITDVRVVSDRTLAPVWGAVELVYRLGSREGLVGELYNRFRGARNPNELSALGGMLSGDLVSRARRGSGPLIVDHPLLVALLAPARDCRELVYMHGELVAPPESLATGADMIIVPTEDVAGGFIRAGVAEREVFVSGLCVERSLLPSLESAGEARLRRLESREPLTGGFFSSGAEPPAHCERIVSAVLSVIRSGGQAVVFAKEGGRLAGMLSERNLRKVDTLRLITYSSIEDEEIKMAPVFPQLDYYVAPAHERTNWTVACGLPFFWLEPCFGSFAPLNAQLAEREAFARPIATTQEAGEFGRRLLELRDTGVLGDMSRPPRADVYGFDNAATEILKRYFS